MAITKIHLDTVIGGDMDDVCALAMLLKWPDLEITGMTSVSEEQGRRAAICSPGPWFWSEILRCAQDDNRTGIPWATGADVPGGYYRYELDYPPDEEN